MWLQSFLNYVDHRVIEIRDRKPGVDFQLASGVSIGPPCPMFLDNRKPDRLFVCRGSGQHRPQRLAGGQSEARDLFKKKLQSVINGALAIGNRSRRGLIRGERSSEGRNKDHDRDRNDVQPGPPHSGFAIKARSTSITRLSHGAACRPSRAGQEDRIVGNAALWGMAGSFQIHPQAPGPVSAAVCGLMTYRLICVGSSRRRRRRHLTKYRPSGTAPRLGRRITAEPPGPRSTASSANRRPDDTDIGNSRSDTSSRWK